MDTHSLLKQLSRIASGIACVLNAEGTIVAAERSSVLDVAFHPFALEGANVSDLFADKTPRELLNLLSTTQDLASDLCFPLDQGGNLALFERRPEGMVAFISVDGADHPHMPMMAFFDNATDAVFYETGFSTGNEFTSRNFENLLGYPRQMILEDHNFFHSLIHPDDLPALRTALEDWSKNRSSEMFDFIVRVRRADGTYIRLHDRMIRVGVTKDGRSCMQGLLTSVQDTEDSSQAAVIASERMDAIRRSSRSIAHDINNFLVVIQGYAELLSMSLKGNERGQKQAEKILRSAQEANAFTTFLNQIGHPPDVVRRPIAVKSILETLQDKMETWCGENRDFKLEVEPDLPNLVFSEDILFEVLESTARTVQDMTDEGDMVRMTIQVREVEEETAALFPDLKPGVYVEAHFDHGGVACKPEEAPRFFEPFFLKREKSCAQHNGLAMTRVWNVMFNAGGAALVGESALGGTSLSLLFPQSGSRVEGKRTTSGRLVAMNDEMLAVVQKPSPTKSHGSGEKLAHVLLAEDEPLVRELISETLRSSGFSVVSASDGQRAFDVFKKSPESFHILVTDIVMPNMDGTEFARQARAERPDIPVLFVSGFTKNRDISLAGNKAPTGFLQKPFTPVKLVQEIQALLGKR